MARKFLTHLDLAKNELQNGVIQNLGAAPSTPVKGQIYFNTTDNTLYWWDGTAWRSALGGGTGFPGFGAVTQEQTFGASKNDGVGTTTARNDHAHGNPTHTGPNHSTFPLSTFAAAAGPVDMGGNQLTNLATPAQPTDGANKAYVDNLSAGLAWKDAVRVASTANRALTGLTAVDGVTPIANDRVLLKNQTAPAENGIWLAQSGAWTRALDADSASELEAATVFVMEGTTLADTAWVMTTNAPITVGTTGLTWAQFSSTTASVPLTRLINTTAPLTGGGDLSADRTLAITASSETATGAVELATAAETTSMVSSTLAIHPAGLGSMLVSTGVTRRFAANCAAATSTAVAHNFGTRDVLVNVYRNSSPWDTVECDVERTDSNTVTVRFNTAPAASEYRIVVVGQF